MDRLPSRVQVDELLLATTYAYRAGELPADASLWVREYVDGDGGLLKALGHLKRALTLVDKNRLVEDWHGIAKVT